MVKGGLGREKTPRTSRYLKNPNEETPDVPGESLKKSQEAGIRNKSTQKPGEGHEKL